MSFFRMHVRCDTEWSLNNDLLLSFKYSKMRVGFGLLLPARIKLSNVYCWDNTNWRAGRAGGPCFQMEKVNFRRVAAHKTEGRAGGLRKRAGRTAEKGNPPARLFGG